MSTNLNKHMKLGYAISKMREFFLSCNYIEVNMNNNSKIMPNWYNDMDVDKDKDKDKDKDTNVMLYNKNYLSLLQSNKLCLDQYLLNNSEVKGCFSINMDYPKYTINQNKENSLKLDFAGKGNIYDLIDTKKNLLDYFRFPRLNPGYFNKKNYSESFSRDYSGKHPDVREFSSIRWNKAASIPGMDSIVINKDKHKHKNNFYEGNYVALTKMFGVEKLENEHLNALSKKFGTVFFVKNTPLQHNLEWNSKYNRDSKISKNGFVILDGIKCIVSGENSCSSIEMRELFHNLDNGKFKDLLYDKYTKQVIDAELNDYLKQNFFPRYTGSIEVESLVNVLDNNNLIPSYVTA